jgi:hypothetical protein
MLSSFSFSSPYLLPFAVNKDMDTMSPLSLPGAPPHSQERRLLLLLLPVCLVLPPANGETLPPGERSGALII